MNSKIVHMTEIVKAAMDEAIIYEKNTSINANKIRKKMMNKYTFWHRGVSLKKYLYYP